MGSFSNQGGRDPPADQPCTSGTAQWQHFCCLCVLLMSLGLLCSLVTAVSWNTSWETCSEGLWPINTEPSSQTTTHPNADFAELSDTSHSTIKIIKVLLKKQQITPLLTSSKDTTQYLPFNRRLGYLDATATADPCSKSLVVANLPLHEHPTLHLPKPALSNSHLLADLQSTSSSYPASLRSISH